MASWYRMFCLEKDKNKMAGAGERKLKAQNDKVQETLEPKERNKKKNKKRKQKTKYLSNTHFST